MKYPHPLQPVKWFLVELIGTAILAMTVGAAVLGQSNGLLEFAPLFIPLAVGTIVAVMVYTMGYVTGAHFNPAVTVSMFIFKTITTTQFFIYLVAQILGAFFGFALIRLMMGEVPLGPVTTTAGVMAGEFIAGFILVFAIMSVVLGKVAANLSGVVIGGALMIAAMISMAAGSGLLNPALALGMSSYKLTFLLMPVIGGIAGAGFAVLLDDRKPAN